ncbi:MAG TPA: uroporphyrinogen decarboxylase family protein [Oscillospiraceae bacterium]|nr:uroporphyrinogen decarboxylase family protein [Oscillospiraceae bacterium]
MAVKDIFKCKGNTTDSISETILEKLDITYKEANNNAFKMAMLSKALRKHKNEKYCTIPFCHTAEAEALGSTVIFNQKVGNRISEYCIKETGSIENIETIDLNKGRISKVLDSIKILKDSGEDVILCVTGPISIATSIFESRLFYRAVRKERDKIDRLLATIEDSTVKYMLEAIKQGADIISFADPAGTMDIVGPKVYSEIAGKSVYNILKCVENKLMNTIVHLCGKTSTSLEAIGFLESEEIEANGKNYFEMIENIRKERENIKFIGHWCLKLDKPNNEVSIIKLTR